MENEVKLEVGYGLAKGGDAFATGGTAAKQALSSIREYAPCLVLVFASISYDLEELLQGIQAVVGDVPLVGATTAGEICNGPQHDSVVVTILASPYLEVAVGLGQGVSYDWQKAMAQAVRAPGVAPFFSPDDDTTWSELTLQGKSAFAFLFVPGETFQSILRGFEILEELKRLSQNKLPVIGGAAGDNLRMETNYVLWGRQAYPDSLLLVVCQTQLRFGIAMSHGLKPTDQRVMVTRANNHDVLELDGQPAAEGYCRVQGYPREDLEGKHLTMVTGRPLGTLDPYGQYSINVAAYFTPDGGLRVAQPVSEGTMLTIMAGTPEFVAAAGGTALKKALLRGSITQAAIVLAFSCCLRAQFLGECLAKETQGMKQILPDVPITGFYSMGEQGLADDGVNRNNTEVIAVLVLGREFSYAAQVAREREGLRREVEQAEALKRANAALEKEVAERKLAEEALRQVNETLRATLDAAPIAIFDLDTEGRVKSLWNAAAEEMLGWRREEVLGRLLPSVEEENQEEFAAFREWLSAGKPLKGKDVVRRRKDGTLIEYSIYATPEFDADGQVSGNIAALVDITERKSAEEVLKETNIKLENMVAEVNERHREAILINDMVEALQSCLSHEEAYPIIGDYAQQLFPHSSGSIFKLDPHSKLMEAVTDWGKASTGDQVFPSDDCWAIRRGRPYLLGGPFRKERRCRHLPDQTAAGYLCIPLTAQGETYGLMQIQTSNEIDASMLDQMKHMAVTIGDNISLALANIRLRETLRHQVMHDPLTGLFNRRYLDETLKREIARVQRKKVPLGVIMMDLDHFKRFNDSYGHEAGDSLLQVFGAFLQNQVRQEDVACRYGGEEFVLVMPEVSPEVVQARAEAIRQGIPRLQVLHQGKVMGSITISLGVAMFPEHGTTAEAVLRAADDAMYQAKAQGRDRVVMANNDTRLASI
jgi:diguanylate cyclase (GGDEF)-like protein/PAS domain S-box-containing protein